MDFLLPEGFPKTYFEDPTQPFDLVFQKAPEQGLMDGAMRDVSFATKSFQYWTVWIRPTRGPLE